MLLTLQHLHGFFNTDLFCGQAVKHYTAISSAVTLGRTTKGCHNFIEAAASSVIRYFKVLRQFLNIPSILDEQLYKI
jgi:hypothetical protein